MFNFLFNIALIHMIFARIHSIYNGKYPATYFQNVTLPNTLPQLNCVFPTSQYQVYQQFGEIDQLNPLKCYRLKMTQEMKDKYFYMGITTCCDSGYCYNEYKHKNNDTQSFRRTVSGYSRCEDDALSYSYSYSSHNNTFYVSQTNTNESVYSWLEYCNNNDSLDTYLYLLQDKKGTLQLLDSHDDGDGSEYYWCFPKGSSRKSVIDLADYSVGEYIVAVGGFQQEYGPQCI